METEEGPSPKLALSEGGNRRNSSYQSICIIKVSVKNNNNNNDNNNNNNNNNNNDNNNKKKKDQLHK